MLKDINLSIASGMITVLLGHNGAGKTLLMQVVRLLMPSSGTISSIGRTGQKWYSRNLLLRAPQASIDFICPDRPAHIKQDGFTRLDDWPHATPSRLLSGGEQQKLSLISVLATQPKLLFLDEPCANLDFEAIDFVEAELLAARETGMTIIMSSHSRHQAQKLADYIILKHSRIAE